MGITDLAHVLVLSDDIDATRDFYVRTLGLTAGARPPLEFPGHWLYAGEKPCLHIAERSIYVEHARRLGLPIPDPAPVAHVVDHIAFAATDFGEVSARLEAGGVDAVRNSFLGVGMRQLFFEDPEGVRIEVNVFEPAAGPAAE